MRLPVNLKTAFGIAGLGLGTIALIRAAIWLPLLVVTPRTWLHLAIGLAPLFFLGNDGRQKYLCYATLLAGAAGAMLLGASYLNCSSGDIFCAVHDIKWQLSIASFCYVAMAGLGLWWLRRLSRRAEVARPPGG